MKTLVVIPTYNEAQNVAMTLEKLFSAQPEVDVVVVDDNSPDGTGEVVRELTKTYPRLHFLSRAKKAGLGSAYLAGFDFGLDREFDLIVEMDADGSHRSEDLSLLLAAVQNADLVIGSRWIAGGRVENWPYLRKAISRVGNRYAMFALNTSIKDMTSGYRVYRSDFLEKLIQPAVSSHGYAFQVELAFRASKAGRVEEVPITFVEREQGKSKMTLAIVLEALAKVTFWGIKRILS